MKHDPKEKLSKGDRQMNSFNQTQYDKNMKYSITDIKNELMLNVFKSTVCRSLKCLNFKYRRLPHKFHLSYRMRVKRVEVAMAFLTTEIP